MQPGANLRLAKRMKSFWVGRIVGLQYNPGTCIFLSFSGNAIYHTNASILLARRIFVMQFVASEYKKSSFSRMKYTPYHARVLERVAKSQFPHKAVVFKSGDRFLRRFLGDLPPPSLWRGTTSPGRWSKFCSGTFLQKDLQKRSGRRKGF